MNLPEDFDHEDFVDEEPEDDYKMLGLVGSP